MRLKRITAVTLSFAFILSAFAALSGCSEQVSDSDRKNALKLSSEGGLYTESFTLKITKANPLNKIYYTLDGSEPDIFSEKFPLGGLKIEDVSETSDYRLTKKVRTYQGYGEYTYGQFLAGTCLRLKEVNSGGAEVAQKSVTYIVTDENTYSKLYDFPVICLSSEVKDWTGGSGIYNDPYDDEAYIRGELEYYDALNGESFSLNSKIKIGGGWTRGYPQRTLNLNFKKDENGEKNAEVKAELFKGSEREDGKGKITDIKKFRLHSGGNGIGNTWFPDAFTQSLCEDLNVSTTSYRPCTVFINGEFWGLYAMREKYDEDYFENNYGIDDDYIIFADRRAGFPEYVTIGNERYQSFGFDVSAKDIKVGYKEIVNLFLFLKSKDFTKTENYRELEEMVDLDSLIDFILVNGYVCNWDFMCNNFRMWKSTKIDKNNPYADGRWRFCLHDSDFSFNEYQANGGISWADRNGGKSYFDFYVGNAYMDYSQFGVIPERLHMIWSKPLKNAEFKSRVLTRAYGIMRAFEPQRAIVKLDEMKNEVSELMSLNCERWNMKGFKKKSWLLNIEYMKENIRKRPTYFLEELKRAYSL